MKIVISGAGVAGPALAHWLIRDGHEPDHRRKGAALPRRRLRHRLLGARLLARRAHGHPAGGAGGGLHVRGAALGRSRGPKAGGLPTDVVTTHDQWPLHQPAARRPCRDHLRTIEHHVESLFGDEHRGDRRARCRRSGRVRQWRDARFRSGRRRRRTAFAGSQSGLRAGATVRDASSAIASRPSQSSAIARAKNSFTSRHRRPDGSSRVSRCVETARCFCSCSATN